MITRIQLRRDSASNWTLNNPTLAIGEFGIDTDTYNFKIGNGVDNWNNLEYFSVAVQDVISQDQLDAAIASIGGDGIVFDSIGEVYNLDYANTGEVGTGTSTTKVLTPSSIQFMILDGGEFN